MVSVRRAAILAVYLLVFWAALPLALAAPHLLLAIRLPLYAGSLRFIGVPAAVLGLAVMASATVALVRRGHGLPVSSLPPARLVADGVYGRMRHPLYSGYLCAFMGVALILGSAPLLFVSFPLLVVGALAYVHFEERTLERRYGRAYRVYRREVPALLPSAAAVARTLGLALARLFFSFRVRGQAPAPAARGCLVVAAHECYLDPGFIALALDRPIRFLVTHDMYRSPASRLLFGALGAIRFDRYRPNLPAIRAIVRVLDRGGLVGVFPEGGRSWYGEGCYAAQLRDLVLRRRLTVLPLRIRGAWDAWPRWGSPQRSPVSVDLLPAVEPATPAEFHELMRSLRPTDERRAPRRASPRSLNGLERILYLCPACWTVSSVFTDRTSAVCSSCGSRYSLDGRRLVEAGGRAWSLPSYHAEAVTRLRSIPSIETSARWTVEADGEREAERRGSVLIRADERAFIAQATAKDAPLVIPYPELDAVIVRGPDCLQLYTAGRLLSFTMAGVSALLFQDYLRLRAFGNVLRKNRWQEMLASWP